MDNVRFENNKIIDSVAESFRWTTPNYSDRVVELIRNNFINKPIVLVVDGHFTIESLTKYQEVFISSDYRDIEDNHHPFEVCVKINGNLTPLLNLAILKKKDPIEFYEESYQNGKLQRLSFKSRYGTLTLKLKNYE